MFKKQNSSQLSDKLTEARILHERVSNYIEFLDHPQVRDTGLVSWIDHQGIGRIPLPNIPGLKPFNSIGDKAISPGIGEDSHEILSELGYNSRQIKDFVVRKIISIN